MKKPNWSYFVLAVITAAIVASCSGPKAPSTDNSGSTASPTATTNPSDGPGQTAKTTSPVDVSVVEGLIAKYSPLHFYKDLPFLLPGEMTKIQEIAQALKGFKNIQMRFRGHTALAYTPEGRYALSLARAETVRWAFEYRVGEEITSVTIEGWGAKDLISRGGSETEMAPNRRVDIVLQNAEK